MGAQSRKPYIQVNTLAPNRTCLAVPARVVLVANARVTSRSRTVPGAKCQQIWAAVTWVPLTWVAVTWVPVPLIWAVVCTSGRGAGLRACTSTKMLRHRDHVPNGAVPGPGAVQENYYGGKDCASYPMQAGAATDPSHETGYSNCR